jgi:hypothetical protein
LTADLPRNIEVGELSEGQPGSKTDLRAVLIGSLVAAVIIGVFFLGWVMGGKDGSNGAEPQSVTLSVNTTNPAGGSTVGVATTRPDLGKTEATDNVEPFSGPTLPLTLTEFQERWNAAAEQAESLLTLSDLALDLRREKVSDSQVQAPFTYTWDNVELRGWAHTQDDRLDTIIVQVGTHCQFVMSEDGELVEECQGTFEDSAEEGLRFFELRDLLLAAIHPGLDPVLIVADWLIVEEVAGFFLTVGADGYPPVVNGVRYLISYSPSDGFVIMARPAE